jgi:hypothetical protein
MDEYKRRATEGFTLPLCSLRLRGQLKTEVDGKTVVVPSSGHGHSNDPNSAKVWELG